MKPTKSMFIAFGCCAFLARPLTVHAANWPQFNLDSRHSGGSLQESTIHTGNVASLHVRYHVQMPAVADGAPAFLQGVSTPAGVVDLLFLDTKDGRLLAVNAASGGIVWSKQPATGPQLTTSSPAVDPNRQFVYAYGLDGKVHKYGVGDGTEVTTGGWPEVATLKPAVEKGSSALTIATAAGGSSYLYAATGGYVTKTGDYQGHITVIDLATGAQNVFNANCSDQTVHFVASGGTPDCTQTQSGIWSRGGVVYDSDVDKIFFATGAGPFDADTGGHDWGDSFLALHPNGTGSGGGLPLDSYTPDDHVKLQQNNLDFGSSTPAILPFAAAANSKHPHLVAQASKEPELHLLDLDNLSGQGGPGHIAGEIEPVAVPQGGPVVTALAVWTLPLDGTAWMFIANDAGISAMQLFVDASGNTTIFPQWSQTGNGGSSPIVANGIVYYAGTAGLRALDPVSGNQLWSDTSIGPIHWESPIVVDGRLYVTDENAVLWSYEPNAAPTGFYTLPPCRVIDTRGPSGPYGAPALQGGTTRTFAIGGQCGVPSDAQSIATNLTIVTPASSGFLQVAPANVVTPGSVINFAAGAVLANNAIVSLTGNPVGSMTVTAGLTGNVDFLVDVVGYFK